MKRIIFLLSLFIIIGTLIVIVTCNANNKQLKTSYPKTTKTEVVDELYGTKIVDDYRWLENDKDPEVHKWVSLQEKVTMSYLDKLPQRQWIVKTLDKLHSSEFRSLELLYNKSRNYQATRQHFPAASQRANRVIFFLMILPLF